MPLFTRLAIFCTVLCFTSLRARAAEPVEELRRALKAPGQEPAARDSELKRCVAALAGIADLRQALILQEWRDQDVDPKVAAVDQPNHAAVLARFEQAVRDVLRRGDTHARLAVVQVVAETADAARGFTADLIELIKEAEPPVRAAAARALGRIDPDPDPAAAAFEELLTSGDVALRLAAADGLAGLLQSVTQVAQRGRSAAEMEAARQAVLRVGCAVVPVAGNGLTDPYPPVRRRCAEVFGQVTAAVGKQAAEQRAADPGPVQALLAVLGQQGPALGRALEDSDPQVRLLARQTMEELARVTPQEPLSATMQAKLPALALAVTDPDVKARRAAIDVLESFGPAAAPAAPALVKALSDSDRFVRWAAARTLGRIGPVELPGIVPALAQLLADSDLDVRLAAAGALEQVGLVARTAVPALAQAVTARDAELRVAVIRALGALGVEAKPAVPTLATALADPDVRVRQAAAAALARLGPAAQDAAAALRQALHDEDAQVRKAAGDALLAVQGTASRP